MKEQGSLHEHHMREHKNAEEISKLAEQLTPPEEIGGEPETGRSTCEDAGALVVDTGALKLPKGLVDNETEKRGRFGLEPVIVVILILLISFIALIAFLVYKMPTPVK